MAKYSDWRSDLREVMDDDTDNKKVTGKGCDNKKLIKINPKLGEAVEQIGGQILEVAEVDTVDGEEEDKAKKFEKEKQDKIEDKNKKKEMMLKKRIVRMKMMAVNQGAGDSLVAHHEPEGELIEGKKKGLDGKACWDGYKLAGTKKKGGKTVDNCVKEASVALDANTAIRNVERKEKLKRINKTLQAMRKNRDYHPLLHSPKGGATAADLRGEEVEVVDESKGHKYDDSFIEGETGSKTARRNLTRAMSSTRAGMGKPAADTIKRRERHADDRGVKTKGTKAGHSGSAYPKMSKTLDDQYPHKKTYRLKQKAAARKAGKKYEDDTHYSLKKKTVGEKLPKPKNESVEIDEATRLKKEKGYTKGGTKKPSGKPTAMSVVLDKIRKEHGHGAVVGQGGSRQKKKEKGAKSTAGTGKYLKRAKEKAAYAAKAKKAGFKNTQDYTNTMAVYGGEANYKSGKGLDT